MISDQKPIKFGEEKYFLDYADKGLGESLEEGLVVAEEYARSFVSMEEGSGMGFAKFLHGVNFCWNEFEKEEGDNFPMWAVRVTSRHKATIQRRLCTWELLSGDYVPVDYREDIRAMSVKMLGKLYRVALLHKINKRTGNYEFEDAGYDLQSHDWLALSQCVDDAELVTVMDLITGKTPNSNRMSFKIKDSGEIVFYMGKKEDGVVVAQTSRGDERLVKLGVAELLERIGATEFSEY